MPFQSFELEAIVILIVEQIHPEKHTSATTTKQENFNDSNTDGSFELVFESLALLPTYQEKKYLRIFSEMF